MIDYQTFVKIKVCKDQHGLKCSQIARELNLDYRTVEKWLEKKQYQQRKSPRRVSKSEWSSLIDDTTPTCWRYSRNRIALKNTFGSFPPLDLGQQQDGRCCWKHPSAFLFKD